MRASNLSPTSARATLTSAKLRSMRHAPDAVLIPHEAVLPWLYAWGTPDEAAADRDIKQLEQRLMDEARNRASE